VLENRGTTIALCVVDSLGVPLDICQKAKELVQQQTGIPVERIMISAHSHAIPPCRDGGLTVLQHKDDYAAALPGWIAESIVMAHSRHGACKVGATSHQRGSIYLLPPLGHGAGSCERALVPRPREQHRRDESRTVKIRSRFVKPAKSTGRSRFCQCRIWRVSRWLSSLRSARHLCRCSRLVVGLFRCGSQ
jgi:hypothetical protein